MENYVDRIKPDSYGITTYLENLRRGQYQIPTFQRDVVWDRDRVKRLWDSIYKFYPLGSILVWRTEMQLQNHREIGGYPLRNKPAEREFQYLLDGQQRLAAIDAITWRKKNPLRLWLDLAPEDKGHPLKFKYGLHACTCIFPFGFRLEANGEHDFAVLHDREMTELWECLQHSEFKGKEWHDIPLAQTRPWKAGWPVPLDELVSLLYPTLQSHNTLDCQTLSEAIVRLAATWKQHDLFHQQRQKPDEETVQQVARGLLRVQTYKLAFQLLTWEAVDDEDDYTLFERIGRGGVQITQRQLAVSKLLLELGPDGNNTIAAFQSSKTLQHLLETEEVIHALARVAFTTTEPDNEDLLDLTPQRIKSLQKEPTKWDTFIKELQSYCQPSNQGSTLSRLQHAFEQLYTNLRYHKVDNPSGFPFAQLAQPARTGEGIAPITLHPLVYWYLKHADGEPVDTQHRDDMMRWVLFANGLTGQPRHPKLNSQVFQSVVRDQRLNFTTINNLVFDDAQLVKDLGLSWYLPMVENGGLIQHEHVCNKMPEPDEVTCRTARRLLLQNWSSSGITWFLLMWNQREVLEKLYGSIDYRPALFSKGRPFDADHIVARSRFLYTGIHNEQIRHAIHAITESHNGFQPLTQMHSEVTRQEIRLLEEWCFRKNWSNTIANYRYWPKRLNCSDQARSVPCKINTAHVQDQIIDSPLQDKLSPISDDGLWAWSAIPQTDRELWRQLPPQQWNEDPSAIGAFILATLKREHFLYLNAYRFLVS